EGSGFGKADKTWLRMVLGGEFEAGQGVQNAFNIGGSGVQIAGVKLAKENGQKAVGFVAGTDQKPENASIMNILSQAEDMPTPQPGQFRFAPIIAVNDGVTGEEGYNRLVIY